MLARARRLDGGIECEEVRLLSNAGNRADDFANLLRAFAERRNRLSRMLGRCLNVADLFDGFVEGLAAVTRDVGGFAAVICRRARILRCRLHHRAEFMDGLLRRIDGTQLLVRALGDLDDAVCDLIRCLRRLVGRGIELFGRRCERFAAFADLRDCFRHAATHVAHRGSELAEFVVSRYTVRTVAEIARRHEVHLVHHRRERTHDAVDCQDDADRDEDQDQERDADHDLERVADRGKDLVFVIDNRDAPARSIDRAVERNHIFAVVILELVDARLA